MNVYERLDEFAKAVLPVLLSHDLEKPIDVQKGPQWVSQQAYEIALAMLKQRAKVKITNE